MAAGIDRPLEPLDESRRRAYLHAMGIDLWVPRGGAAGPVPPMEAQRPGPAGDPLRDGAPPARTPPQPSPPQAPPPGNAQEAPPTPAEPPPDPDTAWDPVWESAWEPAWEPVWEPELEPAPATHPAAPHTVRPDRPTPAQRPAPGSAATPAAVPAAEPPPLLDDPAALDWDALAAAVAGCRACALCETRTQTVFGVGDRQARLLVIGEAPGADEDREGEPFVGRAGRLLNQMLAAIGLARDQVYIANVLKCRPPGNRNPHPAEVQHCHGYLARQVELIQPRVILSVGAVSAQNLLGTDTPVGRLRGRWFDYGPAAIALRVTYHPAYLLRSPDQKARTWEDLIEVARRLRADG